MDLKQIEKLMAAMEQSRIKRIVIKREGFEIEIEKESAFAPPVFAPAPVYTPPLAAVKEQELKPAAAPVVSSEEKSGGHLVTSPMVGTFYASPSPEDPPFVKVGDSVNEDTVVCIIEAMKVMNEVKAGVKGTVTEIFLKSGEPVEFGTRIFRLS